MKTKLLLLLLVVAFAISSRQVKADRMESDSYVIQFGNFNMSAGEETSSSYNMTHTMGQIAPGPFDTGGTNYYVYSGFQYIYQIHYFGFSISNLDVDLGLLTASIHNTASTDLTVNARGAGGYNIYAYELKPLTHDTSPSTTIPDTNCDSGCTISSASVWTTQSNPGFGFNMSGTNVSSDFTDSTYFRPFADDSDGDAMQVIMTSSDIAKDDLATVNLKAGVSGNQAAGQYQTGLVFVAVPGY